MKKKIYFPIIALMLIGFSLSICKKEPKDNAYDSKVDLEDFDILYAKKNIMKNILKIVSYHLISIRKRIKLLEH